MTQQIEVTPAMIDAGLKVLNDSCFRHERRFESDESIVKAVFWEIVAMMKPTDRPRKPYPVITEHLSEYERAVIERLDLILEELREQTDMQRALVDGRLSMSAVAE